MAAGANVAIATLIGRGEREKLGRAVQTVYTLSLLCVVLLEALTAFNEMPAAALLTFGGADENTSRSKADKFLQRDFP